MIRYINFWKTLIILLLASCGGTPTTTNSGIVIHQDGYDLVVAPTGLKSMRYQEANEICANMELDGYSDWRLPTKNEIKLLFMNKDKIPNFNSSSYLFSSTGELGHLDRKIFAGLYCDTCNNGHGEFVKYGSFYDKYSSKDLVETWPVRTVYKKGGIIFYAKNGHGLVAAPIELCNSYGAIRDVDEAIYTCDTLILNGFSDWRLPTKNELDLLYINRAKIADIDKLGIYCSSTNVTPKDADQTQTWNYGRYFGDTFDVYYDGENETKFHYNNNAGQIKNILKGTSFDLRVRPVRSY